MSELDRPTTAPPSADTAGSPQATIQLLLFVDRRPSSWEQMRYIRRYLENTDEQNFSLEVVDVSKQPYLAEHFKLIATPTLLKLYPEPRQMLAGSNLVIQLERYWMRWQKTLMDAPFPSSDTTLRPTGVTPANPDPHWNGSPPRSSESMGQSLAISAEVFELSDRIFELEKEKADLEDRLNFKDRLISILAHDLRNPLTAISIALETLETLLNQNSLDERPEIAAKLFHHARTQSRQIDRMITDILETSHSGCDRFPIYPQDLDLEALCKDVLNQQQEHLERKQHRVCTDIPKDLPHAYADGERIRQLISNLIDNAIKYTPEKGTIKIAILHRTSQKLQISISDTGPGIPAEDQTTVFEDRFRLNRDESQEGYGLGLALCQRIVRAHYGRIWVDSRPGCGSTFHFTLPVYRHFAGNELS
ncbi:MAG: histidine kinase [Oscillatoriales cyanobacterium]|jgi:two-component system, OmpR family, clock-associated histidine kinase SasA|nr:MAG: histidine kinase [Oscillatoriales cyanobacterium]